MLRSMVMRRMVMVGIVVVLGARCTGDVVSVLATSARVVGHSGILTDGRELSTLNAAVR